MKLALSLATLFCVSATFAQSVVVIRPGTYVSKHEIALMYPSDAKSCNENGGEWEGEGDDAICIVKDASDVIDIKVVKSPRKKVLVDISTVTTNIHTCDFQGESKALANGKLLVSAPAEVYDSETGKFKADTCQLIIDKKADGLSSSIVRGKEEACQSFCGMNASLEIEGAVKEASSAK